MTPLELRAALPRTWEAFLARFGTPTEIQCAAAPALLAGRDALLCAPTASGKTEGYLAPLVERYAPGADGPPKILLVSPTRALVNDLHRRVEGPLHALGVGSGRWTGDHHDGGRLHPVTVLTPEGLDSRLARSAGALAEVGAVVLDELHVLDDTARGDQLRILIRRLRGLHDVQVIAASATVADPRALADRYLHDAEVVSTTGRRRLRAKVAAWSGPGDLERLLAEAVSEGRRKVLAFCNSRVEVERLAHALQGRPPFGDAVFAHHGSLAREVRLAAERRFLQAKVGLCFATSTLELGIDIGDIDLVVLVGPPPDVSSLLQRAGRGGRRADGVHVLALAADPFDAVAFQVLLAAQRDGRWFDAPPVFRPSVLVQQAISVLHERRSQSIDAAALRRRLPPEVADVWDDPRLDALLEHLRVEGWLERGHGRSFAIGAKIEARWARGVMHANLADGGGVTVIDQMTGEAVGVLAESKGTVRLGGRGRRVLAASGDRVVTEGTSGEGVPRFPVGGRPPTTPALARALLEGAGIPAPCVVALAGRMVLFHGLGTAGGALAGEALREAGVKVDRAGPLAVVMRGAPAGWPVEKEVRAALGERHGEIVKALGLGAWHRMLPARERLRAVEAMCDVGAVMAAFEGPARVVAPEGGVWRAAAWG